MTPVQKKFLKVALGGAAVTVGVKKGDDAWKRRIAKLPAHQANRERNIRKGLGVAVGGYLAANLGAGIYVGNKIGRKMVADYARANAGPPMAGLAKLAMPHPKAPGFNHNPLSPFRSMGARKRVVLPKFNGKTS